jgi:hypothetical protein
MDPVAALVVLVVWVALVVFAVALCGTNTRVARREQMTRAARLAERALTHGTVAGWQDRPEAATADDREVRCLVPRREAA